MLHLHKEYKGEMGLLYAGFSGGFRLLGVPVSAEFFYHVLKGMGPSRVVAKVSGDLEGYCGNLQKCKATYPP